MYNVQRSQGEGDLTCQRDIMDSEFTWPCGPQPAERGCQQSPDRVPILQRPRLNNFNQKWSVSFEHALQLTLKVLNL